MSAFYQAMVATLLEDAAGKPCLGCGIPSRYAAVWVPTPECLRRDFKVHDELGRTCVYPICGRCAKRAKRSKAFCSKIEAAVIVALRFDQDHAKTMG